MSVALDVKALPVKAPPRFSTLNRAPVQRKLESDTVAPQPLVSLASIPVHSSKIQRKCDGCDKDEKPASPVQPRLEVGAPDDKYEREADDIAGKVMAMRDTDVTASSAGASIQRACSTCNASKDNEVRARRMEATEVTEEEMLQPRVRRMEVDELKEDSVQPKIRRRGLDALGALGEEEPKARMRAEGGGAPGSEHIAASDSQLTSGGSQLPAATQSYFENRMGRDLSDVRVHQGSDSEGFNGSINARAFTYQNHVWLGRGETASPSFTMAHELAHVMQQTAPGPVGPDQSVMARRNATASNGSDKIVRRTKYPFWLPGSSKSAKKLHASMHVAAQDGVRGVNSDLLTEVPIPGANRKAVATDKCGFADFYTASSKSGAITMPGLELKSGVAGLELGNFTKAESSASCIGSPSYGKVEKGSGKKTGYALNANHMGPSLKEGVIANMNLAPTNVKIGELKPAHNPDYRKSGYLQIQNYIDGLSTVIKETNNKQTADGKNERWSATPTTHNNITIPTGWDAKGQATKGWPIKNLKIRGYDTVSAVSKKTGKKVKRPKAKDIWSGSKHKITGRWVLAKDSTRTRTGDGVYVYFLAPNPDDVKMVLKDYKTMSQFRGLEAKIKAIYAPLTKSPTVKKVHKRPLPKATLSNKKVSRRAKDNFNRQKWEAIRIGHKDHAKESEGNLLEKFAETAPDKVRGILAEHAAMANWANNPAEKSDSIKYAKQPTGIGSLIGDFNTLRKAGFWTGLTAASIGLMREKFGGFFVKAFEKFNSFRDSLKRKFEEKKEGDYLGKRKGTIRVAAAKVAAIVVPKVIAPFARTMFNTIVECGVEGFKAKMQSIVKDTPVDQLMEMASGLRAKIETVATDAETQFKALIKETLGGIQQEINDFVSKIETLTKITAGIAEIAKGLRIASCVAGLISAPETVGIGAVVGCGAALADWILSKFGLSPIEYLVALTLQSCPSQNTIGKLVSSMSFMQKLPKLAGSKIVNLTKKTLKDNFKQDVGSKTLGIHASELFCNIDDKTFPATAFEDFKCGGGGKGGSDEYKRGKENPVTDPPKKDVDLFESGDPVTAKELKHMGDGRTSQIPPASEGGNEGDANNGESVLELRRHSVVEGKLKKWKTKVSVYYYIHGIGGGFKEGSYDKTKVHKVKVTAADSDGDQYGPDVIEIHIHKVYPDPKRKKVFKMTYEPIKDYILITNGNQLDFAKRIRTAQVGRRM